MIRDQALFASGLLVEKLGGPSVRPYQPTGLAKELTGTEDYVPDHGPSLYRRSLYTFWKRTIAPPTLMNFDAANRETCVVRVPAPTRRCKALNLLNDVTFVEAARVLAERVMKKEATPDLRLALAWRLATARSPNPGANWQILKASSLDTHHDGYDASSAPPHSILISVPGEGRGGRSLIVAEHAAYGGGVAI